ncbi:MAG: hypothetical protein IT373_02250 [Polyangiaceae bacterium]|nr:hypothetical protein [Polyangiaceae bacterium]
MHHGPGTYLAALALLAAACAPVRPRRAGSDDGWSTTPPPGRPSDASPEDARASALPRALPAGERPAWERAPELASLEEVAVPGPSEHLGGGSVRRVLVNETAARYAHLAGSGAMPAGALVVQRQHRPGEATPDATFVMAKREPGFAPAAGDWEYVVLDALGRVELRGSPASCVRCHLEAPYDSLFGPGY